MADELKITLRDGTKVTARKRDVGPGIHPSPRVRRIETDDHIPLATALGFDPARFPTVGPWVGRVEVHDDDGEPD